MTNDTIKLILQSEQDTAQLAQSLAQLIAKQNLSGSVWLSGDLGAGKTTLTRYWLQALGHKGKVKSPTYTLVEPYTICTQNGDRPVYHVDLYRLQDFEELEFIGFDEYQQDDNALLIIEWASRAEDYLLTPVLRIDITRLSESDNNHTHNSNKDERQVVITLTKAGKQANLSLSNLSLNNLQHLADK